MDQALLENKSRQKKPFLCFDSRLLYPLSYAIEFRVSSLNILFFKTFLVLDYLFIYLFLERWKEGKREGEKHQCVLASHMPPSGDLAHNTGMCPDWELNQRPFGPHAHAQSTELHQPGQTYYWGKVEEPSQLTVIFHLP